ncbi:MAG TPA: nucleoside deaminase [Xanthobacteraceae bacterium]|jgi:tRNA(adenine34) deaminase|nr:nucleoside deaminase [Xanthobacteraceae bacterium]
MLERTEVESSIEHSAPQITKTEDNTMMARCIELSRMGASKGEYPFGAVIVLDGRIVAEGTNQTLQDEDLSRHAEIVALAQARKKLTRKELRRTTLYSNVEPCPMCAFCIRETQIGRVVIALKSPVMGGLSKWNILRDETISDRIPQIFGSVPEVVTGVLAPEAGRIWHDWSPLAWEAIKFQGLLVESTNSGSQICKLPTRKPNFWNYLRHLFFRGRATRGAR